MQYLPGFTVQFPPNGAVPKIVGVTSTALARGGVTGDGRQRLVSVNGRRVRTIGIGDNGVLGAHLSWFMRPGELRYGYMQLGGLNSHLHEHHDWLTPPPNFPCFLCLSSELPAGFGG